MYSVGLASCSQHSIAGFIYAMSLQFFFTVKFYSVAFIIEIYHYLPILLLDSVE